MMVADWCGETISYRKMSHMLRVFEHGPTYKPNLHRWIFESKPSEEKGDDFLISYFSSRRVINVSFEAVQSAHPGGILQDSVDL